MLLNIDYITIMLNRQIDEGQSKNYNILVAKKTEKIVTAIYLISQFLDDNEPIKFEIRKISNDLLRDIHIIGYSSVNNFSKNIFSIYESSLNNVSHIISLLFIAKNANLISNMNVDIVVSGLRALENILNSKQFILSANDLNIQEEKILNDILYNDDKYLYTSFDSLSARNLNIKSNDFSLDIKKEKIKENKNENNNIENSENIIQKDKIENNKSIYKNKNKILNIKTNIIKDIHIDNKNDKKDKTIKKLNNLNRKNSRRDQILSLFIKGIDISINDISKKIVGCSTKTIQRELNDLVNIKKIKKIGEKRWSRYTLIDF